MPGSSLGRQQWVVQRGFIVTKFKGVFFGAAALIGLSGAASAGLAEQYAMCVDKFANAKTEASVMLECTAADGKLSACKVVESSAPGFDKAAMCVAEALPIGSKTGAIRVPLKFNPKG